MYLCADSLDWLSNQSDGSISNIVTGLPDYDEVKDVYKSVSDYLDWFNRVAELIFTKVNKKGYVIFIQTDRKKDCKWIDKSYYLNRMADDCGVSLLWHKIALLRRVGAINLHRPTYSHILAFSGMSGPGASTPDVIDGYSREYSNGTPLEAARLAISFIFRYNKCKDGEYDVVDPFVGRGTVTKLANEYNLKYLGIDIDQNQINCCINQT